MPSRRSCRGCSSKARAAISLSPHRLPAWYPTSASVPTASPNTASSAWPRRWLGRSKTTASVCRCSARWSSRPNCSPIRSGSAERITGWLPRPERQGHPGRFRRSRTPCASMRWPASPPTRLRPTACTYCHTRRPVRQFAAGSTVLTARSTTRPPKGGLTSLLPRDHGGAKWLPNGKCLGNRTSHEQMHVESRPELAGSRAVAEDLCPGNAVATERPFSSCGGGDGVEGSKDGAAGGGGEVAQQVACQAGDSGDLGAGCFEAAERGVFAPGGDAATSVDRDVHPVAIGEGVQGGVQDHHFGEDSAEHDHTAPVPNNRVVGARVIPAARAGCTDVHGGFGQ